jgi:cytohesin
VLLSAGADPNARDNEGNTPAHHAASEGNPDILRLLLNQGADPNDSVGFNRRTLLHLAAAQHPLTRSVRVIELLLESGADVNKADRTGETPLHVAASQGHKGAVECLLAWGADCERQDVNGRTPVDEAWRYDDVRSLLVDTAERRRRLKPTRN